MLAHPSSLSAPVGPLPTQDRVDVGPCISTPTNRGYFGHLVSIERVAATHHSLSRDQELVDPPLQQDKTDPTLTHLDRQYSIRHPSRQYTRLRAHDRSHPQPRPAHSLSIMADVLDQVRDVVDGQIVTQSQPCIFSLCSYRIANCGLSQDFEGQKVTELLATILLVISGVRSGTFHTA
ncbi:hypothetical protein AUP68_17466 [Ilyonectria robusta]